MIGRSDAVVRGERLRQSRKARGYATAIALADARGWNRNSYSSNENGNAPFSFSKALEYGAALGVSALWLYGSNEIAPDLTPPRPERALTIHPWALLIGTVGPGISGEVHLSSSLDQDVPMAPGGSPDTVALCVEDRSLSPFAARGGLIYFEARYAPPSREMIDQIVVAETLSD